MWIGNAWRAGGTSVGHLGQNGRWAKGYDSVTVWLFSI